VGWILWAVAALVLLGAGLLWSRRRGTAAPASEEPSEPEHIGRHSLLPDGSIPQGPWQPPVAPDPPMPPLPRPKPVLQEFDQPLYPDLAVPEPTEQEVGSALAGLDANSVQFGPSDLPSLGTADRPRLPAPRDAVDDEDPIPMPATPVGPEPAGSEPAEPEPEHTEPQPATDSAGNSPDSGKID
jgi:hypothetical protein